MKSITTAFLLIIFFCANLPAQPPYPISRAGEKPKLVIGLVVENMRPDYVLRYWDKFGNDGFRKLYSGGAVHNNINMTQHIQSYATGTATLFTGVYPSVHGIVGKSWYDRFRSKEADCTEDDYYFTVGADTEWGNASARKLLSSTITDNLKVFTRGKSLVFSAAMNRETAIFAAGHSADGAYWLDHESGKMISSSFYVNTFPEWVMRFNNENYPEMYSARNWVTLLPETEYTESVADNYLFEKGYFGKYNTYPHKLGQYTRLSENLNPLKTTPYANLIIKDFAIRLLENEPVGEDDITDFITIAFSSMDYENGSFGPVSLEMQDTYLYMDKYIGELITFIENKFGKDNVLIFLTANTSASYPVDYLKEEFNLPVDNFSPENAIALLTSYLNITYGQDKWIKYYDETQIYLDHDLIKKRNVRLDDIRNETSNFINQFEGIQLSMTEDQIGRGNGSSGLLSVLFRSYFKNRSGDILFMLKEGWQPSYKFKKINYTEQSHIPLVFYGSSILPQIINEKNDVIDILPTLCDIIQIPYPDKCQGSSINLKK
jgi:predicted AlkP superfamily pyrophosphatase or phosphodiesterase